MNSKQAATSEALATAGASPVICLRHRMLPYVNLEK